MSMSDHPVDIVNESIAKLTLLTCCLSHTKPGCTIDLTERAIDGLFLFLNDIEFDLLKAVPELVYQKAEVQP